ncbi:MAG: DUF4349 domain-containing protein [Planctomycetales bacterium]|nr:DUF4349 domain-containing protein [Planctomycetales bacterium]
MKATIVLLFAVTLLGCGSTTFREFPAETAAGGKATAKSHTAPPGTELNAETTPDKTPIAQRKIIQTADLSLVVNDFTTWEQRLAEQVAKFSGYIAESKVDRTQGSQRTGRWVVRVPVEKFDEFVEATASAGIPESRQTHAQDVTEVFVDLQTRLVNKREIERRIVQLLENHSGDIKDVLSVEAELGRVREEIERTEARLNYLTHQTELTTVTITAREQQAYVPPQAPRFVSRIGQVWSDSLRTMMQFGRGFVLFAVAVGPWLFLLAILVSPLVAYLRRRMKRTIFLPQ